MAQRRPSRQELLQRQQRGAFVGRVEHLAAFRENLTRDPEDEAFRFLWHVHGQGGVGKTTLLRRWRDQARERGGVVTVSVEDDVHDAVGAMESMAASLRRQGLELRDFERRLEEYHRRRHEAAQAVLGQQDAAEPPSAGSAIAARSALLGLGAVPGVGSLTGVVDAQQVAAGIDRMRTAFSARLGRVEDVRLVTSPLKVLTPLFLEDLDRVARARDLVVLFFDVWERIGPVLDSWLSEVVCRGGYGDLAANVVVVLSGQGRLNPRWWGDWAHAVTQTPLEVFTESEARDLLARRGVRDEATVEVVLRLSGRLPVLVDMLAQPRPTAPGDVPDLSETAVERFLKWVDDPDRRTAALHCALPLWLDEDVYRAAVPPGAADHYAWLRGLPFVRTHDGQVRYHETVRALMLRHQRTGAPGAWRDVHTRLADHHRARREEIEAASPDDAYADDAEWREHRRNETYHRLCAQPRRSLTDALAGAVRACDHGLSTLRRWVLMLDQAGRDTDDPAVTRWGRQLAETASADDDAVLRTLRLLLTAPGLDPTSQALAHALAGREHGDAGRHQQAVDACTRALALDPNQARAFAWRGESHRLMDHHEQALADLDRAIELEPDYAWALASRGHFHGVAGRYEQALADLDRAIELEPDYAWALACRGEARLDMGHLDRALADLDRALELDPDHVRARFCRGETHRLLQHHDQALADLDQVITSWPDVGWVFASRGHVHHQAGRYEQAVADFDRAVELDPDDAWAVAWRGETHYQAGRYEQAVADFDRAVELDPDDAWAVAWRGETHYQADRYEQAVADFDRAVELDPDDAWAVAWRGETHRLMDRYEQAVADFDRAIELDPDYAWALGSRGEAQHAVGAYDRALADLDRALELRPHMPWALRSRGETHHAMGAYDRALADLDRALELQPDQGRTLARRGDVQAHLGAYDRALADLRRAVDLDPDNAWFLFELAVACRLAGDREEQRCWDRAVHLLRDAAGTGDGADGTASWGELFVVTGAMGEWEQASAALDEFLGRGPTVWLVREARNELAHAAGLLALDEARVRGLRARLEAALAAGGDG